MRLKALGNKADLLQAIEKQDVKAIIQAYGSLPEKKTLASEEFHAVVHCIHLSFRSEYFKSEAPKDRQAIADILAFVEVLVQDVVRGNLVPNVGAHMRLLAMFKESKALGAGEKFWNWLHTQDDSHVGPQVYAVAIELLALAGHPLQDGEKLYEECLARYPGTFFAYHLSPNAILPNREQPFDLKGVPLMLLRAVTRARLLGGDTQGAYLALDTSLRIFPARFSGKMEKYFLPERPITEAYAIYAMTYRAGLETSATVFKTLFSTLRFASNVRSVPVHFQVLRAMLSILYLYVGTAKTIASNTLSELTIAITHIALLPGVANLTQSQRDEIFGEVLEVITKTWDVFSRYQAFPTIAAFNSLLAHVGAAARSRAIVDVVMANMKTMGMQPTDGTRRAIMSVAGAVRDEDLIQKTWSEIVEARGDRNPDLIDVRDTIKAARNAGMTAFVQQTAEQARQYLSSSNAHNMSLNIPRVEDKVSGTEGSTAAEILEGVRKLRADLAIFDEKTKDPSRPLDFSKRPGMLLKEPLIFSAIPEAEMRKLYDEFTTEQVAPPPKPAPTEGFAEHETSSYSHSQTSASPPTTTKSEPPSSSPTTTESEPTPSPPTTTTPHLSATGLSLSTLRYESWRAINSLLHHSAANDRAHTEAVDVAIWQGQPAPARNMGFTEEELEVGKYRFGDVGLSDWLRDKEEDGSGGFGGEEEVKRKVELARREIAKLRRRE
jgi:hypothetical protein